jgi:AcrR family transcriptional regulator
VSVDVVDRVDADLGRRARKKLETRRALVSAALELFAARGVDTTTVEDIADAVNVSARTFHRYFPAKEDVLFADSAERRERFAGFLADRPADEPLLATLRAAAHDLVEQLTSEPDDERRRMRLIAGSETLRARGLQYSDLLSLLVAEHAARRLDVDARQPLPLLLGACTIAALRTARERWLEDARVDPRVEIDRCFELLADLRTATAPRQRGRRP